MKVERYTTADGGWPGVRWRQEVVTGETLESRGTQRRFQAAGIGGVVLGALVWVCGGGWIWAAVAGVATAGMIAAPGPWENVRLDGPDGRMAGPWPRTESERSAAARLAVTPIYREEARRTELVVGPDKVPKLVLSDGDGKELASIGSGEFAELELGAAEEWFGDVAERKLAEMQKEASEWVIVAATNRGVFELARSGRGKAGMAVLHRVLVEEFIGRRPEIAARIEELADGRLA